MQIHELNTYTGTPGDADFLATDNGTDTSKISAKNLLKGPNDKITNLQSKKVNQPLDAYNQPTNGTNGQLLRTKGDGKTEWVNEGLPTDAQTAQAVSDWLDDHPEATTSVQDGSLTEAKFTNELKYKTINDYVTPEKFGAVGDGITDDTNAINQAIGYAESNGFKMVVFTRNYLVSVNNAYDSAIPLKSNIIYEFLGDSSITIKENAFDGYSILSAANIVNFAIINATLNGDRLTHTGSSGEWGHGLTLLGCQNFYIDKINITNTWGDGIYIADDTNIIENGYIGYINISGASRNGVTIESGKNLFIDSINCQDISRTLPKACVDFETDAANLAWNNVVINTINSVGCWGGVRIVPYQSANSNLGQDILLKINTINIDNSAFSDTEQNTGLFEFDSTFNSMYSGWIIIGSINIKNANRRVILKTSAQSNVTLAINKIYLQNIGHLATYSNDYVVNILQSSSNYNAGNLYLYGVEEQDCEPIYLLKLSGATKGYKNTKINIHTNKPIVNTANSAIPITGEPIDWLNSVIKVRTSMFPTYKEHTINRFTINFIATDYIIDDDIDGLLFPAVFPIRNKEITIIKQSAYTATYNFGTSDWDVYPKSLSLNGNFAPTEKYSYRKMMFDNNDKCIILNQK